MTKRTPAIQVRQNKAATVLHGEPGTVGQDKKREIPVTGPARIEEPEFEVIPADALRNATQLENEKFMEEIVGVTVATSDDPRAAKIIPVGCNGRMQHFIRGQKQLVKRKFLECLARAKPTAYKTEIEMVNFEPINHAIPRTGMAYPFEVWQDTARGRVWLEEIKAQP